MSPADFAASALNVGPDAIVGIERIKHGLTNESWLARTRDDAVVVRISIAAEDALQIDRRSEATILAAVSAAGIGPPVLLCDPSRHLLVTRYLGETWTQDDAARDANIRRLAQVLYRLHRIGVPDGVRRVDLVSTVEGYLRTLDRHGFRGNLTEQSLREGARQAALRLSESSQPCLCHNDVHYLNIVVGNIAAGSGGSGGDLRLIDWEYAGIGERSFDLASACVYHGYDQHQRERLLSAYCCRPGEASQQRLELACWLFEYIRDLWMAVREIVDDGKQG